MSVSFDTIGSVVLNIYAILLCVVNLVIFQYFMCGMELMKSFYKRLKLEGKVRLAAGAILAAFLANRGKVYLLVVLFAEFCLILFELFKRKKLKIWVVVRGVIGLIVAIATQLIVLAVAYNADVTWLSSALDKYDVHIVVVCYITMAICMCEASSVIVSLEEKWTWHLDRIILTVAIFAQCIILAYLTTICAVFDRHYVMLLTVYSLTVFIVAPSIMVVLTKSRHEKHAESNAKIHANLYEYYLNMEEEHRQIRKMYHEMKNQLMIMQEKSSSDGGQSSSNAFSDNMLKKIDEIKRSFNTGCPELDALLFDSRKKAEEKGINFEVAIAEGCLTFMNPKDIDLIFRNAILNAIEACEKITDTDKNARWIKIKAGRNMSETLIYIKNSAVAEKESGILSTTKVDKTIHGIGMTTIRESAERYDGYVSVSESDGAFQLAILFHEGEKS